MFNFGTEMRFGERKKERDCISATPTFKNDFYRYDNCGMTSDERYCTRRDDTKTFVGKNESQELTQTQHRLNLGVSYFFPHFVRFCQEGKCCKRTLNFKYATLLDILVLFV